MRRSRTRTTRGCCRHWDAEARRQRERAAGMVAEAQQKRAEVLQTLGHERSLLQQKIDELRTFERDYRARLKSHLESQLRELEQSGADGGSGNSDGKRG